MAAETAAQLFSRLGCKQSLEGLDNRLFADIPQGIQAGDVIEFYGKEGCGKTEMLLHLIANCILPKSWQDLYLGGRGVSVIFIDTDYHFQLLRLISILEHRIKGAQDNARKKENYANTKDEIVTANDQIPNSGCSDYEPLIKECLSHLFISRCNSSIELLATTLSMEQLIITKPEVCVMMIDSLSAFYWVDRNSGGESSYDQEENIRKIIGVLSKYSKENHLVVLATKHTIFSSKHGSHGSSTSQEYMCKSWQQVVKYKYLFERQTEYSSKLSRLQPVFVVKRTFPKTEKFQKFYVEEHGIEFAS